MQRSWISAAWFAGVVAVALLPILLVGCAKQSTAPVELTQKDSGTTQELSVGRELRVSLDANPTTGYTWVIDGELPQQLRQEGEPAYSAESAALGSGGTEVWVFVGESPGTGLLKLKYWRSFEPTVAPAATFELTVRVE